MATHADVDRGPHLAATYIAGCAISFVFVAMRLCARFSIAGVGIDDWCMLVTWLAFVPLTVLVSMFSFGGGTRHLVYLSADPTHTEDMVKLNWIAQPFAIFCLGSGKIAVAFLILRLLNRASVWRRYSLYVASAWTTVNTIVMIVFTFAQCRDATALWDSEVKARTYCWDPRVQSSVSIYGGAVHCVMDFFLALLPITLVWGLKTDLRRRIALCGLLGCGSITGICAAIKTSKLVSLNERSDVTWETFSLFLWTGIEIILLIVCGSIPALKPLYAIFIGRRPMSMRSTQKYTLKMSASRKSAMPRDYGGNNESDTAIVMATIAGPPSEMSRISHDGAGPSAIVGDEKVGKGIRVLRTIDVEYREGPGGSST